jgi:ribosomal-protein-alanine N-acetyltransferase
MRVRQALDTDFEWMAPIQKFIKLPLWKPNQTTWVMGKSAFAIWQKMGDECELLSMAVMERNRRKGYATKLMEHAHGVMRRYGVIKFFLEVRESNIAAISLYSKLGYEKISEKKCYYSDSETAIVMKLG